MYDYQKEKEVIFLSSSTVVVLMMMYSKYTMHSYASHNCRQQTEKSVCYQIFYALQQRKLEKINDETQRNLCSFTSLKQYFTCNLPVFCHLP